ncbi:MAG TPA: adenylate/guanylate cyclase domain-containing protein [Chitinophagaceae bacterium]|nr:adenylate/guanylate cyclase domain-containing protein [Chitinophagaceae bacterium]
MSATRQLAAIMFIDIVGYTAMMQDNEVLALQKLHRFKENLALNVTQFGGEIIQYYGDGCVVIFPNATDSVSCARVLQEGFRTAPSVPARIGLHMGDIVIEEGNIYGDSVNISSRIESMGVPGAVLLSNTVREQIQNKPEFELTSLGNFEFRNVKEPIEVFVLSNDGFPVPDRRDLQGKFKEPRTIKSVAVLPFVNMSNDPEQEYFSDGITEEIINSLTHLKELRVAGRTSSFHFKNRNIDLRLVGQKLNVGTVLEGSVRKQGRKLRVTAQLINVEDGFHLWSERYDKNIDDIFLIQDEIAFAITERLKLSLFEKEKAIIQKNPTEHTHAYDLYLKGRFYLNKRGAGIKKGLEYFQQALEIDPAFALAYSGMADAYSMLCFYGAMPPNEGMPKARLNAEKAIQSDPLNAEGFTTLAFINVFYGWNWEEAEKRFQEVFQINPNYAVAHYWHSYLLSVVKGKFEEGIEEARNAAELLEPFVSLSHHVLSVTYITAGKFEEALQAAKMAIEIDANSFPGFRALGISLACLGRYEEAIEALKTCAQISSRHPWPLVELCWVYSLRGIEPEIQNISDELIRRSKTEYISGMVLSAASYFTNKYDQAFEFMELAFSQRDSILPFIKSFPSCSFLRTDPRFQPFIKRMNFPE